MRVVVHGLEDHSERLEAYRRVQAYLSNPRLSLSYILRKCWLPLRRSNPPAFVSGMWIFRTRLLPAIRLVHKMGIDSLRAEITWFEAARAYTSADGRLKVTPKDLQAVAPMSLRLRRSQFMTEYFSNQSGEEEELDQLVKGLGIKPGSNYENQSP